MGEVCRGMASDAEVTKCAESVVSKLGCRFIHLRPLVKTSYDSLEKIEAYAEAAEYYQVIGSLISLDNFEASFPEAELSEIYRLFKDGVMIPMREFSVLTKASADEIVETLMKIKPHPFYLNPNSRRVAVGSNFILKAINKKSED